MRSRNGWLRHRSSGRIAAASCGRTCIWASVRAGLSVHAVHHRAGSAGEAQRVSSCSANPVRFEAARKTDPSPPRPSIASDRAGPAPSPDRRCGGRPAMVGKSGPWSRSLTRHRRLHAAASAWSPFALRWQPGRDPGHRLREWRPTLSGAQGRVARARHCRRPGYRRHRQRLSRLRQSDSEASRRGGAAPCPGASAGSRRRVIHPLRGIQAVARGSDPRKLRRETAWDSSRS